MRPSLGRRVSCLERALAAHRRDHYLWQDEDETDEAPRPHREGIGKAERPVHHLPLATAGGRCH